MSTRTLSGSIDGSTVSRTLTTVTPAAPPAARFCRVAYRYASTLTVSQEAGRYGAWAMQCDPSSVQIAGQIRAANPGALLLAYQDGQRVKPSALPAASDPARITMQVLWADCDPTWFLLDAAGQRISKDGGGSYLLDPASAGMQQYALAHTLSLLAAQPAGVFAGVFLDEIDVHLGWRLPTAAYPPAYPTDAAWQAAQLSYLRAMVSGLHAHGYRVVGNIGGAGVFPAAGCWQSWGSLLDGAMEESFTSGTDGKPEIFSFWQAQVQNALWSEQNGKLALLNADLGRNLAQEQQLNLYGLCSMLLVAGGQCQWDTSVGAYAGGEFWTADNDMAIALGAPSGAHQVLASQLRFRQFQNGRVVVNPLGVTVQDPVYGSRPANTGLILLP